jgi:antitoxin (DNA-binding transcriptional repressor) of toxin-antitoxin stability system
MLRMLRTYIRNMRIFNDPLAVGYPSGPDRPWAARQQWAGASVDRPDPAAGHWSSAALAACCRPRAYDEGVPAAHIHELPSERGRELVLASEEVEAVERGGEVVILTREGRPVARVVAIDPEQAWFWTAEWQAKEREVDEERAAGVPDRVFDSGEEFIAYLKAGIEDPSKL